MALKVWNIPDTITHTRIDKNLLPWSIIVSFSVQIKSLPIITQCPCPFMPMSIHFASSSCPCNAWQHFLMPLTAPSFQMWYFDHQGPMFVSFRGLYYFIIYSLVHSSHLILTHHKILHVWHIRATNLWGYVITYLIQPLLQFAWTTVTEKSELK